MITIPRIARKYLNTPFFHVIIQGINKEYIFNKGTYIKQYLKLIDKYTKELDINIIAYCMMDNHGHFLLEVNNKENLSLLMQKVNSSYAKYYNYMENGRVGYVFRDRFLSEPIFDQKYLLNCIKYIHLNPVKSHIVAKCEEYPYSSYKQFLNNYRMCIKDDVISQKDYEYILKNKEILYDFIDIKEEPDIEEEIRKFLVKNDKKLIQIFNDRESLKQMIKYLKEISHIKYIDIMKKLDITKGTMERLKNK